LGPVHPPSSLLASSRGGRSGSVRRTVPAVRLAVAESLEERCEVLHLLLVEYGPKPPLDVLDVSRRGLPELREPIVGENRVAHTRILLAGAPPDQALVHQPIEQPRDPGRR